MILNCLSDKHLLYLSHGLSAFGDRLWQFAVPVLFLQLWSDTLLPVALCQLLIQGGLTCFLPSVGTWVGKTDRLKTVLSSIFVCNLMTTISCSLLISIPLLIPERPVPLNQTYILLSLIILCGLIGELLNQAGTIALEKHWVVILANKDEDYLTEMNSVMKRIDLGSKLLAPVVTGILVDGLYGYFNDHIKVLIYTATIVGVWNLISLVLEFSSAITLYGRHEALKAHTSSSESNKKKSTSWNSFTSSALFLPGVSLAFLYCSVLTNGVLMTAWLQYELVPVTIIGMSRGAGAFFGIGGTYLFPGLIKTMSLEKVGHWNIFIFFLFMLLPSLSFAFLKSVFTIWILVGTVVISRASLWLFDMSYGQMIQVDIKNNKIRSELTAAQTSLCTFMNFIIYVLGVICSDPREFGYLSYASSLAVGGSLLIYSYWIVYQGRLPSPPETTPLVDIAS